MSPVYVVQAEPVFQDHVLQQMGKRIRIATTQEVLEGIWTGAAVDHLQLTINGEKYHIRYQQIIYFKECH